MLRFSRFVKKKQDDKIILMCKLKKGTPTGKQYRSICDALNEAIALATEPKKVET